jgi:hypothetical protein
MRTMGCCLTSALQRNELQSKYERCDPYAIRSLIPEASRRQPPRIVCKPGLFTCHNRPLLECQLPKEIWIEGDRRGEQTQQTHSHPFSSRSSQRGEDYGARYLHPHAHRH